MGATTLRIMPQAFGFDQAQITSLIHITLSVLNGQFELKWEE